MGRGSRGAAGFTTALAPTVTACIRSQRRSVDSPIVRQRRAGWGERLRYSFDNFMARGTTALIIGLGIVSAVLLVGAAAVLALVNKTPGFDFLNAIWQSFLHTIDSGYIENDKGGG